MSNEVEKKEITHMTRAEFEAAIVEKAWNDEEYKKRLISSPKEVLEEELQKLRPGIKLPGNLQVTVHEETPASLHISLPMRPKNYGASGEEWLEDVSGGCIAVVVAYAGVVAIQALAAVNLSVNANVNTNVNINVNVHVNVTEVTTS